MRRLRRFRAMRAIRTVRHRPPPVRRRVVAPHFRTLGPVLMPRPRLEIAELLVVHLIHLAEKLDHHAIRIAVIDRNIMSDDVAERSPGQRDLVLGQKIGSPLYIGPVAHLKRDMMDCGLGVTEKIDGVMIAAAAQKGEKVAAPVRHAKTEEVAVELYQARHIGTGIGDVAELEWHHAGESVVVGGKSAVGKDFKGGAFRILERQRLADARGNVVAPLAFDSGLRQPRGYRAKIAAWCDLK